MISSIRSCFLTVLYFASLLFVPACAAKLDSEPGDCAQGEQGLQGERGPRGLTGAPGQAAPRLRFVTQWAYAIAEQPGDRMGPVKGCDQGTPIAGGCHFDPDIQVTDEWVEIESEEDSSAALVGELKGFACEGIAKAPGARIDVWIMCAVEVE